MSRPLDTEKIYDALEYLLQLYNDHLSAFLLKKGMPEQNNKELLDIFFDTHETFKKFRTDPDPDTGTYCSDIANTLAPFALILQNTQALQQWDEPAVREAWQRSLLYLHRIGQELDNHAPGHYLSHPVFEAVDTILSQQVFTRLSAPATMAAYGKMAKDDRIRIEWEDIKVALAMALHTNHEAFSTDPKKPENASDHVSKAVSQIAISLSALNPAVVKEQRSHFLRAAAEDPELAPVRQHWNAIIEELKPLTDTLSTHAADLKTATRIAMKFNYGPRSQPNDHISTRWSKVAEGLHATAGKVASFPHLEWCVASLHDLANDLATHGGKRVHLGPDKIPYSKDSIASRALRALDFISQPHDGQPPLPDDLMGSIRTLHAKIIAAQEYRTGLQKD